MYVKRKDFERAVELALKSISEKEKDLFYIELQSILDALRILEDIRIVG